MLTLKGHTGSVNSVAFSSDGQWLASAGHDKMVKVWKPPGSWGEEWHGLRELDLTTAGMVAVDVDRLAKQLRGEAAKVCAAPPAHVRSRRGPSSPRRPKGHASNDL